MTVSNNLPYLANSSSVHNKVHNNNNDNNNTTPTQP